MRPALGPGRLTGVNQQRVILDAALYRSVIRGALIAATGERREFHGSLELNTALEAMLTAGADRAPTDRAPGEGLTRRPDAI